MKAGYIMLMGLCAVWLCASSASGYEDRPVCPECQKPIYPMSEILYSGGNYEAIANTLCSQYGHYDILSALYISKQLSFFHGRMFRRPEPPFLPRRERMPLKINLMVIEYCRWVATAVFTDEDPKYDNRKMVTAICREFTEYVKKEKLESLLDWQRDTEERARLAYNKLKGYHPSDKSSSSPYGTHSVIDQETAWNDQKWEGFLILRAHELLKYICADNKEGLRRMLYKGGAHYGFPPALNAMANYIRKTTEEKDWTEIDKIILEYQELEQRRIEHLSKMYVGDGQ